MKLEQKSPEGISVQEPLDLLRAAEEIEIHDRDLQQSSSGSEGADIADSTSKSITNNLLRNMTGNDCAPGALVSESFDS